MARKPDQRDSGGVGLPRVEPGMNKLPPRKRTGGRGTKDDDKNVALGAGDSEDAADEKLLARMRKRFTRVSSSEGDNRRAAIEDRKFYAGEQWAPEVAAQRNFEKRPCLTINKVPTFVRQVTNSQRENRPSINVTPVGDRGDVEVAKMMRGLIRSIERDSHAELAYDTGFEDACRSGFGYWRLLTEYESSTSFNQRISIARIRNPFTVYLDDSAQDPEGADAKWGFVTSLVPRDEYETDYPDAEPFAWQEAGMGDVLKDWVTKDEIRIAEYFEIQNKERDLVQLSNGFIGWKDELSPAIKGQITSGKIEILHERTSLVPKVCWFKCNATQVLERNDWAGSWIPIVRCVGDEIDIEGKPRWSGIVRWLKEPQRMYNYWKTAETELIALAPKAPWIMEEGQVEGHEADWKVANTKSFPYLLYKGTSIAGTPAPPPQRQPFAGVPAGVVQAEQSAAMDMMAVTGIRFDATMQERMIDESGRAIRELRRTGDITTYNYPDNQARALRRTGELLIDLIPKVYDTKRVVTILREDDKEELVQLDPNQDRPFMERRQMPQGQPGMPAMPGQPGQPPQQQDPAARIKKIFNHTIGQYGITVTIGPSYASKRIEAAESMMAFAKAMPNVASLVADLIAKNQDWPGAEEMAARLAKAVPPQFLTPDQKDIPPQVQAAMQAMDAQIKQLTGQLQQAIAALGDKQADRAIDMDKINKDFEIAIMRVVSDVETKMAKVQQQAMTAATSHIGSQLKDLAEGVRMLHGYLAAPADGEGEQSDARTVGDLPPNLADMLTEGMVTHFGNGSRYTLENGKPRQVNGDAGG